MPGLRADQIDLYRKDMYKAEREGAQEKDPMYPKIFKVVTKNITGAGMKEYQMLSAGPLKRHTVEGQDIDFKSPIEGWTTYVKYHTYSDGLTFAPEAVEDTQKLGNILNDLANTWGREVRISKENLSAGVFNNGGALLGSFEFNGSYTGEVDPSGDLLYDNAPYFNLAGNLRTTKGGGTYYNSIAGLTVTPANFETVYNLMTAINNRDEQDRVSANDVDTVLTAPGTGHFLMNRILLSEKLAGALINDVNPYVGLIKNIYDWDYLSDIGTGSTGGFYVGKAQHPCVQFHERMSPLIRFFRNENNQGYKASIRVRFGVYLKFGAWRAWGRGGGSST